MLVLGFDTATPWGTMALVENEDTILEVSLKVGKGGGEYLLAFLETLFQKSGRNLKEIGLIVVGTGPGSYTGIRVGIAAMKGMAEGLNIPVYGLSTLRIIAENALSASNWVASVIDARRGEIYAALYQKNNQILQEVVAPTTISAEQFAAQIADLPEVVICGDGSKVHQELWRRYLNFKIAPRDWDRPKASLAARLGQERWIPGTQTDLLQLAPCYLRKVEAEVRLEERFNAAQNRTNDSGGS